MSFIKRAVAARDAGGVSDVGVVCSIIAAYAAEGVVQIRGAKPSAQADS